MRVHKSWVCQESILMPNSKPGEGVYSEKNWVGVSGRLHKTLTLFMPKICDFQYHAYDLTVIQYTVSDISPVSDL